mgnify:CR=1 FL=1
MHTPENTGLHFDLPKNRSSVIKVIGVDAQTFLDKTSYLMLGVLWQLVRLASMQAIQLADCPEIFRLLTDGEELADL